MDGTCGVYTTSCPDWSDTIDFHSTSSQAFCLDEGLCSDARCDGNCRQTDVVSGCNGDNSSCPGGTAAKYTSGHLLQACVNNSPSMCRCECSVTGATYGIETVAPCTSCGNGICDGTDDCYNCPADCYQTLDLPHGLCVMCDTTGETRCGPGIQLWCCPPN